jgi:hypothetical protein
VIPAPRSAPAGGPEEWRALEFDEAAATRWEGQGFTAFEAALARDDGYSPYNAPHDSAGAARVRQRWQTAGFAPVEARRWHQWNFTASEAARWRDAGFDLADASQWRTKACPPKKAANADPSQSETALVRR